MVNTFILLVDDKTEDLVVLETLLAQLDVTLIKATSGRAALRSVLLRDFALIIMDIHLSDMSGIDVASLIRLRTRSATTPIIFTSAFNDEEIRRRYRLAQNNLEFVSKPFDVERLLKKVRLFLEPHD